MLKGRECALANDDGARNVRWVQHFVAGHGGEVGVAVLVVVEESSPYPRVHRFEESGRLPLLEVATDDLEQSKTGLIESVSVSM